MSKLGGNNDTFPKIIRLLVLNFQNVFDNKGNRCENIWKLSKLGSDNENFPKIIRLLVLNLEND
jgi:hypothetical protein